MRVAVAQHHDAEDLAAVIEVAGGQGKHAGLLRTLELVTARTDRGEGLPGPDLYDALVVLGGPMHVHDTERHPWLADERRAMQRALDAGKPVLGICMGAQQLALVLGGAVRRADQAELGWHVLTLTADGESSVLAPLAGQPVLHWHEDTFDVPPGAIHLASSAGCANQAFSLGSDVLGLQFHAEWTDRAMAVLLGPPYHPEPVLKPGPFVQRRDAIHGRAGCFAPMNAAFCDLFVRFLGLA